MHRSGQIAILMLAIVLLYAVGVFASVSHSGFWWWPPKGKQLPVRQTPLGVIFNQVVDPRFNAGIMVPLWICTLTAWLLPSSSDWITRLSKRRYDHRQNLRLLLGGVCVGVATILTMLGMQLAFLARYGIMTAGLAQVIVLAGMANTAVTIFWGLVWQCLIQLGSSNMVALGISYASSLAAYFAGTQLWSTVWLPTRVYEPLVASLSQATLANGWRAMTDLPILVLSQVGITLVFCVVLGVLKSELVNRRQYL